MTSGEAEDVLVEFLEECAKTANGASVRLCCPVCDAACSLYCSECYEIVISKDKWPAAIREGTVKLPFDVDIILDDRRKSSTGIQMATILSTGTARRTEESPQYQIIDIERNQTIPDYDGEQDTFLLFPGESSLPISQVVRESTIRKMVVLDCKWSSSSIRLDPAISSLPRVHLDTRPNQSYYWRWHNAGEGMVSTVEAIYFCSWDVATAQNWPDSDKRALTNLLWLFGVQREVIREKYSINGGVRCTRLQTLLPFSEDGKEFQRMIRRKHDRAASKDIPS